MSKDSSNSISSGTPIRTCGPMDILAGRIGKPKVEILGEDNLGTKIFDETIARSLPAYHHDSRRSRSDLIKNVVDELLSRHCRFLKYDKNVDTFFALEKKQIRDKVSYAFRRQSAAVEKQTQRRSSTRKNNHKEAKECPSFTAKQAPTLAMMNEHSRFSSSVGSMALVGAGGRSADYDASSRGSTSSPLPLKAFDEADTEQPLGVSESTDNDHDDDGAFDRMIENLAYSDNDHDDDRAFVSMIENLEDVDLELEYAWPRRGLFDIDAI